MQQPNTQQGAYLLHDPSASDAVVLVLYLHCTRPKLEHALPISFDHVQYDKDKKTYLGAVFRNGQDFLGQWSWNEVCAVLAQHDAHAVELLSNTYEACRARLPALREGVYARLRAFAEEQLVV